MIARALKGKILVFAVFFIGIATGILIMNFYETRVAGQTGVPDSRNRGPRQVERVHDYLGLDQAQREQVNIILEEGRKEVRQLRMESRPRMEAIEAQTHARIRAVLTPDQLTRYEEYRRSVRERGRRNRRPGTTN
jgi:hypothetical protein